MESQPLSASDEVEAGTDKTRPESDSDSEVHIYNISFGKPVVAYPGEKAEKAVPWPNEASLSYWMLIERPQGISVDANAAAEKLWRKREKRLRQAQLQSENKEDPGGELSNILSKTYKSLIPTIYFFDSGSTSRHRLETSLSETLIRFDPLAGRFSVDGSCVSCNDEGVNYLEAEALDVTLAELLAKLPQILNLLWVEANGELN
ncbi:hypothetical protein POM88_052760 [Heracleum sosnowskyi]|uniref:Uncharacterized protein n=1 Tax=Heracleum sosnowskyi TaxID=360622 RepID=A0AAD8LY87_9APIA|nr:hypothetical protein POM88_052760 [Heracleum sosnowskyi]